MPHRAESRIGDRLGWYARRLRAMGPAELAWRASRAVADRGQTVTEPSDAALLGVPDPDWPALLARFRTGAGRPVLLDRARAADLAAAGPEQAAAVVAAADRALAGRFRFFGYPEVTLDRPIDWHRDPLADLRWPAVPAARIDHRASPADPKWIWELNRLQHLPALAQAWLFTGEARYADGAFDQLDGWLTQHPPGIGIAWRGAFEAGVRAVSVAVALQGLRDAPGLTAVRYRGVVRMLAASAARCWRQRSRFSSANNHLVGELAGLATVAMLFPELAAAPRWESRAVRGLATEAQRQILPDGAGAEQALGYQVFTAELILVVVTLLRLRGAAAPPPLLAALGRSAGYLAALVGDHDPAPRYGDDDEGWALRLGAEPVRDVRGHLRAVAAVLGGPGCGAPDLTAGWLAGGPLAGRPSAGKLAGGPLAGRPSASRFAPEGGLVLLRSGTRRVTMDIGPLGYLTIAAHGHADALAVTLAVDGHELVGDPGAASYYGHPDWRAAHRGTRAHATVCVDDLDQSVIGGPFLWTRHARVRVRHVDLDRGVVDAEHDGYRRLADPVTHRRWLVAPPGSDDLLVLDLLHGAGPHLVRAGWPLHPSLTATRTPDGHLASRAGHPVLALRYAASAPWERHEVRGDAATNLGWWSQRLESREPSWLVGSRCAAPGPVVLATVLQPLAAVLPPLAADQPAGPADPGVEPALAVELRPEGITVRWAGPRPRLVTVNPAGDGAVQVTHPADRSNEGR